jgi:tRNA(fMet)-specific endonuclease VapC
MAQPANVTGTFGVERRLRLLLDTNVISKIVRGRELSYRENLELSVAAGNQLCTSVIVMFELEYGAIRSPLPAITRQRQASALSKMDLIFDVIDEDATIAARVRCELETRGERIGEYDVLIAAQAIRTESILVTNNRRHFDRVGGLHVIDWSFA